MVNTLHPFMRSINILAATVLILITLTALPGCSGVTQKANITARMDADNSLIFRIQGSVERSGKVTVEYWSDGTNPLVTSPVPTKGNNFSVQVMRLRAATKYNFKVFLEQSANSRLLQYEGNFTSGPLPKGLENAKFDLVKGKPTYGLVLLDFNDSDFNGIVMIDSDNKIVWYYQNNNQVFAIAQRDNHELVFNENAGVMGYSMTDITPDGRKIHSVNDILENGEICQPHGRWHHELLLRPGNKIWTLGSEIRPVSVSGNHSLQTGDTIEEWNISTGKVTRLVSLFDLLDPVKDRTDDSNITTGFLWQGRQNQYAGLVADWTHSNSLTVLPDGKIMVSVRHLNQIIAINPDFKGIAWRLGGPESDFTFPNPNDQFYHQHYVRMLPDGHIILFDNGNFRPDNEGGRYSRALELELDFNTMQAHKVWEHRQNPDLYASAVGSAVRLENGHTLLIYGIATVKDPGILTLVEADKDGNAVAIIRISSPGKTVQYRAIPIETINGETKVQPDSKRRLNDL
jgi:hypothetical protein